MTASSFSLSRITYISILSPKLLSYAYLSVPIVQSINKIVTEGLLSDNMCKYESCWALVPQVCSDLPKNREQPGTAYGSLALKARLFLSVKAWRQSRKFNL